MHPNLTLDGQGPLFKQIGRAVTEQILKGHYREGDRLPSEVEMTVIFKTSRQTVNKAITELAKQGLVERNRRAGTVVSWRFQEHFSLPLPDIGDETVDEARTYEHRILDRRPHVNGRNGIAWAALPSEAPMLYIETLHLANGLPVQLEVRYVNVEVFPGIDKESFTDEPPSKWLLAHVPWSRANHGVKAISAGADLAAKLGITVGAACLVVERQTFHMGMPITFVRMTYPDRFTIKGEIDLEQRPG